MSTAIASPGGSLARPSRYALIKVFGAPYVLTSSLAVMSAFSAAFTLFGQDILRGLPVMNGSARGTALVSLFVAVPLLVVSAVAVARGAVRPVITWLGAASYLLYNAFMFLFMSPFNSLFLAYVAMFGLAVWVVVTLLRAIDFEDFSERFAVTIPARPIAAFLAAIAALNALAWIVQIVPAMFTSKAPAFLDGTGLTTPAGWAQDLAFWIPLMIVAASLMWRRKAWGFVLVGPLLVFGVIEAVGIAADQWFGHVADPSSTVVGVVMTPIFAVVAAVQLVPLYFYFRALNRP
jgi:hypothetical protein